MQLSNVDYRDIQGLVRFGHSPLKEACFLLLRVTNADAARRWLGKAPVTTAVKTRGGDGLSTGRALQVAFTFEGLAELGVAKSILDAFPYEFRLGIAGEESRSRRLGDVGANDPKNWQWGGPGRLPHVAVLLYAAEKELASWQSAIKAELAASGFSELACLDTSTLDNVESFGFVDGTSQPALDWERKKPTRLRDTFEYTNVAALGEFLLGYPNEYCRYTDRPLVDPAEDPDGILPLAEDVAGKRDFGRNGTYLVMRDLGQDVPRFWQFIDAQAGGDATKRLELARAMVGRMPYHLPVIPEWKNIVPDDDPMQVMPPGSPIAMLSNGSIAGIGPKMKDIWLNQFTYHKDRDGTACPYGAHIRRANPRNADFPEGTGRFLGRLLRIFGFGREDPRDDLVASTRFHRILRRGREYGPQLAPGEATDRNAPAAQRGLRFICLNANISRQFEFIQNSWLASPKFDGLNEDDPMVGNRAPLWAGGRTDTFSIPQDSGLCRRVTGMQQFVTVHGGAYFFMPGLSALRYIASTRASA